jgi:pimeloyl-ACP methyl ester carboxylesterase
VVILHGHGAHGDQFFSSEKLAAEVEFLTASKLSIITPNLRDNAWMNPGAVTDLAMILTRERERMQFDKCIFACASMGGTGALIFAMQHPELVDGVAALGAASSIRRYRNWCADGDLPIHKNIMEAIDAGYDECTFDAHDVCAHAGRLTMPLRFYHSAADRVIPVSEMHALRTAMAGMENAEFVEVPPLAEAPNWWSDHDTPAEYFCTAVTDILQKIHG